MAYGQYTGQCIGRLMAFCYKFTHMSDRWMFGDGQITDHTGQIATYTWENDGDSDIPIFKFTKQDMQDRYDSCKDRIREEVLSYDRYLNRQPYSKNLEMIREVNKAAANQQRLREQLIVAARSKETQALKKAENDFYSSFKS